MQNLFPLPKQKTSFRLFNVTVEKSYVSPDNSNVRSFRGVIQIEGESPEQAESIIIKMINTYPDTLSTTDPRIIWENQNEIDSLRSQGWEYEDFSFNVLTGWTVEAADER